MDGEMCTICMYVISVATVLEMVAAPENMAVQYLMDLLRMSRIGAISQGILKGRGVCEIDAFDSRT